ncbi:MAG: hypothetical protein DRJ15_15945 [Bacteroidetes bacterium]|nr:MAG: hypothetical protein DRJ15_15945 [Bacteroidota bacterium]
MAGQSKAQLVAYANHITTNDEMWDEIASRTTKRLFDRFISASDTERAEIGNIINAMQLFKAEMFAMIADEIDLHND